MLKQHAFTKNMLFNLFISQAEFKPDCMACPMQVNSLVKCSAGFFHFSYWFDLVWYSLAFLYIWCLEYVLSYKDSSDR